MQRVFVDFIDKFVVVYLDDIVIYSSSMEEHVDHLRVVLQVLRENQLYVKKEKCSFGLGKVDFLGHIIGDGKIRMDSKKIRARAAHGSVWSGLIEKSDQTRPVKTPDRTRLDQRSGLVWSTIFFFLCIFLIENLR